MQIQLNSSLNFGSVVTKMGGNGFKVLEHIKGSNIAQFRRILEAQESNLINIDFFYSSKNKLKARVFSESPFFKYDKVFKKSFFSTTFRFVEKICKKADKLDVKRIHAEQRVGMSTPKIS